MKKQELRVITDVKKLIDYVLIITQKSPVKYRYSYITKMHNILFEILELLYKANYYDLRNLNRLESQKRAILKLQIFDALNVIALSGKCITLRQFEFISRQIHGCSRLINSWVKSDSSRTAEPLQ